MFRGRARYFKAAKGTAKGAAKRKPANKKKPVPIGPFIIYLPDKDEFKRGALWKEEKEFNIVSIDPGRTNLGFRLESRTRDGRVKTVEMGNVDIRDDSKPGVNLEFNNISSLFDKYKSFYEKVHLVIVEKQINLNPDTPRILQHIISYFLLALREKKNKPLIFELEPYVKGDELGYVKGEDKGLKAWSIDKARELLSLREDKDGLSLFNRPGKKDDMADTICQSEALCKLLGLPLTKKKEAKKKFILALPDPAKVDPTGVDPTGVNPAKEDPAKPPASKKKFIFANSLKKEPKKKFILKTDV